MKCAILNTVVFLCSRLMEMDSISTFTLTANVRHLPLLLYNVFFYSFGVFGRYSPYLKNSNTVMAK